MLPCRSVVEMIVTHARRGASACDGVKAADSARANNSADDRGLIVRSLLMLPDYSGLQSSWAHAVRPASRRGVNVGGAQAAHEAFGNFGETAAHLGQLGAILEV